MSGEPLHHPLVRGALVAATLAAASPAAAQLVPGTPYRLQRSAHTMQELSNPTVIWTAEDDGYTDVSLPFAFRFYEQSYTSLTISANGIIGFPSGLELTRFNNVPGTTGAPSGFIGPIWDDLLLTAGTNRLVGYQVEGTAPWRTVTFEWRNIGFYNITGVNLSFQVRLFEGPMGRIEIVYGQLTGSAAISATMGMEDPSNARPILFTTSGCTENCQLTAYPSNTRVQLTQDPGVEIAPIAITPPELAFLDTPVPVSVTVENFHGTAVGPFTVDVVASPSSDLSGAISIGSAEITLAAFEVRTFDVIATPPLSFGTAPRYFGVVADVTSAITEVVEGNNELAATTTTRLAAGRPDVEVQDVRTTVTSVDAGERFDVVTRVANVGGEPAANVEIALMLSSNPVISPQDQALGSFTVSLASGDVQTVTTSVLVDADTHTGAYNLGAFADPGHAIEELSESNNGKAAYRELTIVGAGLAVLTSALPSATLAQTYAARLVAAGGDPASRRWSLVQGTWPQGIGLAPASGEIFGVPREAGTFAVTVEVESGGQTASKSLELTVADPAVPLTIVTRAIPAAVVGSEYTAQIVATGGADGAALSWMAEGLPAGMRITDGGLIAGTPQAEGTHDVVVTVGDGAEVTSRTLELRVGADANLRIVPAPLPTARFGEAYTAQLESVGGVEPIAWLIQLGRLPAGLTLSTSGEISGTPSQVGRFRFVVEAREAASGQPSRDAGTFELEVVDDGGFVIATTELPEGFVDQGYEASLAAEDGLPPYEWTIVEGRLPEGLLSSPREDGTLSIAGQARSDGVTALLIRVEDAQGRIATRAFVLSISKAPEAPVEPPGGCSCTVRSNEDAGTVGWVALAFLVILVRRRR